MTRLRCSGQFSKCFGPVSSLLLWLSFMPAASGQSLELKPPASETPLTFFGMHIHGMFVPRYPMKTPDPWPVVSFGTWRLWDAYVDWPHLQPEPDKWDFSALDKYVSDAEQHNVEILLPLGLSPAWASLKPQEKSAYKPGNAALPKTMEMWRTYVRTVATRYKGRIHYYEIWNEPNLVNFYSGSVDQLIPLAREASAVLKQVDTTIQVVSPSATSIRGVPWLEEFLRKGGGKYVDIIGFHLYVTPNPPEDMVALVQSVQDVKQRYGFGGMQLWDTESGWRIANHNTEVKSEGTGFSSNVLSDDLASAYVARAYVLLWASGVSRFYWYAWDNGNMGLTEADGRTLKPPAIAYGEVKKWLIGTRMTSCESDLRGTWTCVVQRDGGYKGWVIWNPNQTIPFEIPKAWGVRQMRNLAGKSIDMVTAKSVSIGFSPLILENKAR